MSQHLGSQEYIKLFIPIAAALVILLFHYDALRSKIMEYLQLEEEKKIFNIFFTEEQHIVLSRCHSGFASTVTKANPGTSFLRVSKEKKAKVK